MKKYVKIFEDFIKDSANNIYNEDLTEIIGWLLKYGKSKSGESVEDELIKFKKELNTKGIGQETTDFYELEQYISKDEKIVIIDSLFNIFLNLNDYYRINMIGKNIS